MSQLRAPDRKRDRREGKTDAASGPKAVPCGTRLDWLRPVRFHQPGSNPREGQPGRKTDLPASVSELPFRKSQYSMLACDTGRIPSGPVNEQNSFVCRRYGYWAGVRLASDEGENES
jgi:hypothetical protein